MEDLMRALTLHELSLVAGGTCVVNGDGVMTCSDDGAARKNNNGYGNGPESGPPPGNSGDHNPQLTEWNLGPRGLR
jgi:hypothetical protein